ncbi:MAG TPA: hypothetical protein VLE02_01480 [Nitrosarchaeum sp.]|nr:hypothetical protein [Nitrosarchaeum sp.]
MLSQNTTISTTSHVKCTSVIKTSLQSSSRSKMDRVIKLMIENGVSKEEFLAEVVCGMEDDTIKTYMTLVKSRKDTKKSEEPKEKQTYEKPHQNFCNHQLSGKKDDKCIKCSKIYKCQMCMIREMNKTLHMTKNTRESFSNCEDCGTFVKMYLCNVCSRDKLICICEELEHV